MWFALEAAHSGRAFRVARPVENKPRAVLGWLIGGLTVGLLMGLGAGTHVGRWIYRERVAPWEDGEIAYTVAHHRFLIARDHYLNADYRRGKKALIDYIEGLEDLRDMNLGHIPWISPDIEIALTYARLSLLEEANGHLEAAGEYWTTATEKLARIGWKRTDREHLLRSLEVRDSGWPDAIGRMR
jgi:hypothetical protein